MDSRKQLPCLVSKPRSALRHPQSYVQALGVALTLCTLTLGCRATLAGKLVDEQGLAISSPQARINLIPLKGERKSAAIILEVAEDGSFTYDEPLGDGLYFVEALVPGYKIQSLRFQLRGSQALNLKLEPQPTRPTQGLKAATEIREGRGGGEVTLNPPEL